MKNQFKIVLIGLMFLFGNISFAQNAQYIEWENQVSISIDANYTVTSTATSAWVSSASSVQEIKPGNDGYAEFTIVPGSAGTIFGLTEDPTGTGYASINYAIQVWSGASLYVVESGTQRGKKSTFTSGDVVRVSREGNTIKYKKNGVTFYTSTVAADINATYVADFSCSAANVKLGAPMIETGEALAGPVGSGNYIVNTTNDEVVEDEWFSLREALLYYQVSNSAVNITFDIAGSDPHQINLLSILPYINKSHGLVIDGTNENIVIDGSLLTGTNTRCFNSTSSAPISILGITIQNGFTYGIALSSSEDCLVKDCYFKNIANMGISASGDNLKVYGCTFDGNNGVTDYGIRLYTTNSTVGGPNHGESNTFYGCQFGVHVKGISNNTVQNNYFGLDENDNQYTIGAGIYIWAGANETEGHTIKNNIIANCGDHGGIYTSQPVRIGDGIINRGGINILIEGNQIGMNVAGSVAQSVKNGISDGGRYSIIKNNKIAGCTFRGVTVSGKGQTITGNYLGTKADGTGLLAIADNCIYVQGVKEYVNIGGELEGEGNVIAGGTVSIRIHGTNNTGPNENVVISGNLVGMDKNEVIYPPSAQNIYVTLANTVRIGGLTPSGKNIISGVDNSTTSVVITSSVDVDVINNHINVGSDIETIFGTNSAIALYISPNTQGVTIGGERGSGKENIIGPVYDKALYCRGQNIKISGNYIGTNPSNSWSQVMGINGICVRDEAENVVVGGDAVEDGNIIGNYDFGVKVDKTGSKEIDVKNNFIGVYPDLSTYILPGAGGGIELDFNSSNIDIESNTIVNNSASGLWGIKSGSQCSNNKFSKNIIRGYNESIQVATAFEYPRPVIDVQNSTSSSIVGSAVEGDRIEVFVSNSPSSNSFPDAIQYLGFTTANEEGAWEFPLTTINQSGDIYFTATARGSGSNTSELANKVMLQIIEVKKFFTKATQSLGGNYTQIKEGRLFFHHEKKENGKAPDFKVYDFKRKEVKGLHLFDLGYGDYVLDLSGGITSASKFYVLEINEGHNTIKKVRFKLD